MADSKKVKVWFPEKHKGIAAARVDKIKVPYGKKNAVEVTEAQLERLKATGVDGLQSE